MKSRRAGVGASAGSVSECDTGEYVNGEPERYSPGVRALDQIDDDQALPLTILAPARLRECPL
jgi:hypothetical protein